MKFPIFASFIVFIIWLTYELKKNERKGGKRVEAFWERESRANSTRRKSLADLDYITVPLQNLPLFPDTQDDKLQEYQEQIRQFAGKKIVNFTGLTNTELKLRYGAPNMPELEQYDLNFTSFARTLYLWGKRLSELGFDEEARIVLEYGVDCGTDISGHYILLAEIYKNNNTPERIQELINRADALNTIIKNSLIRRLYEML